MKAVWILEVLKTPGEWGEALEESKELLDMDMDERSKEMTLSYIRKLEEKIANYPDGKFEGTVGRSIYNQFTRDAKEVILRNKDKQYRVVKAEIEDDAQYWVKYQNAVENPGVLKYLYATLNR